MNTYATLDDLKAILNITGTTYDPELLSCLDAASRAADGEAGRHFYTESGSRYFGGGSGKTMVVDDHLSITTFAVDTERDGTYDGETWTESTDFESGPPNGWPKTFIWLCPGGSYVFSPYDRVHKITGVWGAGNMRSNDPWLASGITGTVANGTGTTLTLSAEGTIKAGHTLKIGTEQMFVSAVTSDGSDEATIERGMNGTTAAAHDAAAISIAEYPSDVMRGTLWLAVDTWRQARAAGYDSERIGNYFYKMAGEMVTDKIRRRIFNRVRREVM